MSAADSGSGAMLEISVEVDGEAAEAVCELFERYGGGAVVEVQVRDTASGRALPERRHRVLTYLPVDDVEGRYKLEVGLWHLSLLHPIPEAAIRSLAEANWAEAWKAHYRPLRIPATLASTLAVVLLALLTHRLGGGIAAQRLAAWGYAVAAFPLMLGHLLLTSTIDLPILLGVVLLVVKAVDGQPKS